MRTVDAKLMEEKCAVAFLEGGPPSVRSRLKIGLADGMVQLCPGLRGIATQKTRKSRMKIVYVERE